MEKFWTWLESKEPYPTAATIIVKDGRALILRRGMTAPWMPGRWNLPGGGIDEGEQPLAAAIRECQEETGITPTGMKMYRKINDPGYTLYLFTGESTQEPQLDYENDAHAWVEAKDLSHYDFVPYVGQAVAMVLSAHAS